MATISAMIALRDGMTGPLKTIIHANTTLINAMMSTQNASRHMIDTTSLQAARSQLAGAEASINRVEESIRQAEEQQQRLNRGMQTGNTAANGLANTVKRLAATYMSFQAARGVLGLSDQMAGAQARLELIVDDGGSVGALEQKIFESAQRSRASYMNTMQSVSKFGLLAGKAFSGNDEIIRFAELMNKNFVIAGASAQESSAAMYQLNQALGSGRLQGDEYRSIIENAPLLATSIEDYMRNVQKVEGTMKEWSSKGMLTAEVIKNALFSSADEVEARFNAMPMTFGQIWTDIGNQAIQKFRPILESLNQMANGSDFQQVVAGTINALSMLAGAAVKVFGMIGKIASFIVQNWGAIAPVIWGVVWALIVYNATAGITWLKTLQNAGASILEAVAKGKATAATIAEAYAQNGLNAALAACPLTWILYAVIAIIAIFYALIAVFNKLAGTSYSATGLICGAFAVAGAFIVNTIIGAINAIIQSVWSMFVLPFINIIEWVLNVVNGGFDSFGGAVANLIGQIISWFLSLGKVVTKIIDAIFGTDWTAGLTSLQNSVIQWGKNENAITLSREAPAITQRIAYETAWNTGYDWGENLFAQDHGGKAGRDPLRDSSYLYENIAGIADNTGQTAKNTDKSQEDLKYLRDIAERDVINRFTTAQLSITMNTDAHIASDMDIDGVIAHLEEKTWERMCAVAEGV